MYSKMLVFKNKNLYIGQQVRAHAFYAPYLKKNPEGNLVKAIENRRGDFFFIKCSSLEDYLKQSKQSNQSNQPDQSVKTHAGIKPYLDSLFRTTIPHFFEISTPELIPTWIFVFKWNLYGFLPDPPTNTPILISQVESESEAFVSIDSSLIGWQIGEVERFKETFLNLLNKTTRIKARITNMSDKVVLYE